MNKKQTLKLGDGSGLVCLFLTLSLILASVSNSMAATPENRAFETIGSSFETLSPPADSATNAPRIRLAVGEFDPLVATEPAGLPSTLRISDYAGDGSGYYLVQFEGPIATSDVDALAAAGAQVFDYIPDFTFIVKMDHVTRTIVEEMAQVRWVGLYQPAYRLPADLLVYTFDDISISDRSWSIGDLSVTDPNLLWDDGPMEVSVSIFYGEVLAPVIAQIEDVGGVVLGQSQTKWKSKLQVSISPSRFTDLAAIPGVRWIEEAPEWKLFNNVATDIMGVREVWDTHGLYGAGQTIAVCDTGLDQGATSPGSLHDDFENGSGSSRVLAIHDVAGDGAPNDVDSGHGTHVAGSVLGNGDLSGATPSTHNYPNTAYVGIAPEASLVFQASEDGSSGGLITPADLNDLFSQAAGSGADLHTNSWGSSVPGIYTGDSEEVDEYVWDHKDFTILFAAGNEGIDSNADGVIDRYSIGSPATAKNCITVGATENDRPSGSTPTPGYDVPWGTGSWATGFPSPPISTDHVSDNPEGMAAFSSRGPVLDGRHKPDIVAPGTNIASTRSSLISGDGWGPIDANYMFMGGTSMATPLAAGAATLVRQYYTDRESITPSAALIKATLVNGATNVAPGQYGTGATQEIPDARPNDVAGWGRVNLENSIFPASPRTMLYEDETTGLTTGQSDTYNYTVSSSAEPLHVTLAWSDYPGSPAAAGGLVNDLDLMITGPGGTYYPNNANQRGASQHLTYDDRVPNGLYRWSSGVRNAVRFTPISYPATLQTGLFFVGSYSEDYPKAFNWYVYDGNNTTGPGSVLASGSTTIRTWGWHPVDLSGEGVTISSGDFFLAIELPDSDLMWFYDNSSPIDERSWDYSGGSWSNWTDNDYMFNAIVKSADTFTNQDRVNNLVGIDIESPPTGEYVVTVSGNNVPFGPQPYALVASGAIGGGTDNTAPDISDLPDQTLFANTSLDNAIDLWAYASDAESTDPDLNFSIDNVPDPNAGISVDSNRYIDINPAAGWSGQTDVVIRVTDPGSLSDTDTLRVTVTPAADKTWDGSASNNWHTADNWTPAGVPASSDDVLIPDVTNDPVISAGEAEVDNLTIDAGAVVDLTNRTLTVEGMLTNNGTLKQTRDVAPDSGTEFLRITNLAGNQIKYYGVDITPSGASGAAVAPITAPAAPRTHIAGSEFNPPVESTPRLETGVNLAPLDVTNGDFESGPVSWDEYSTHGWDLIVTSFPTGVVPHGGSWAVWLGGDYDDVSYIQQQVIVPSDSPSLIYWHWIASADACGYDFGSVTVNGSPIDQYDLCSSGNTGGWVEHSVDLSAYAGQSVSLQLRAETDGSLNSNLFIDDVSLVGTGGSGPDIEVLPTSFVETVTRDEVVTRTLTISNVGTDSLTFSISEVPKSFTSSMLLDSHELAQSPDETGNLPQELHVSSMAPLDLGDVVNSFSTPASGFLGLEWVDGYLWAASSSNDTLYRLDPTNGTILETLPVPGLHTVGLAWDGTAFWVSDTSADSIAKVDTSGTVLLTFPAPSSGPVGLAWDGTYLWDVDFNADALHQIDPGTGAVLRTIPAPDTRPAGVAWDGQYLWTNGRDSAMTYQVDPADGSVLASFGTPPGPSINNGQGATFDGQYVWIANQDAAMLYQIDVEHIAPDVPWLSEDPISGTVPVSDSLAVDVVLDATGLITGDYTAELVITSNDPDENLVTMPITMHVIDAGSNTPPTLSGLLDQTVPMNGSADNAIDLWDYADDAEDADADLTFTIINSPDPNAGVSIDSNRYIDINPVAGWAGQTDVEVQVQDSGGLTDTDTFRVTVSSDPDIEVSPTLFDESVRTDEMLTRTLTISNTGGASLIFLVDDGGASWLSENPGSGTVAAEGAQLVDVVFDATGLSMGNYTADLTIVNNDPDENPVTVPITMHVTDNMPPTISGIPDQVVVPGSAYIPLDLWPYASDPESPVDVLTYTIDNTPDPNAGVSIGSNHYVDINPTPGWTGQTTVVVRVTDPGGLFDTDSFSVTVGQFADIEVVPTAFDETIPPDGTLTRTLAISNTGADNLIFVIDDGGVSWLSQSPVAGTVSAGGSQPVDIVFDATGLTPGDYSAILTISNNDPDEDPVTVPVVIHVGAVGDFPDIEVAPTTFDETVRRGVPLTRTLTISNTGTDYLMFVINDGGVAWLSEDPASGMVLAGEAVAVDMVFDATGTTTGDYSTNLAISSNDPDEGIVTVTVTMHVTVTGDLTSVTVFVSGNQFCSGRTTGVKRCFDIDPAGPMSATVRFYLSEDERNGQALDDLLVFHYDGDWIEEPGPYIRGGTGDAQYVEVQNVDDFSPFALDRSGPAGVYLPLIMRH
jgi:hypothetical protein